ncbi:MAG: hypothetical protein SX243_06900 [Acidobacteriota bacterium]|nr:hypothetical protein [Acidobacteriota bacterium]
MGKSHKDQKSVSRSKRQFKRRFAELENEFDEDMEDEELEEALSDEDGEEGDGDDEEE